jgi:putative membrane protein
MIPPFHPHFDVWAIMITLGLGYWHLNVRIRPLLRPMPPSPRTAQWVFYYTGLALLWAASDWPVHDLAEDSLYWVHMAEHMILTLVGPPLLIMGLTRPMADRLFGNRYVYPWLRHAARPVVAFTIFNLGLIVSHWPEAVNLSLRNELAHFLIHSFLFLSAVLVWLPVLSPSGLLPRLRPPMRMGYLFLNSLIPIIPAGFLTFSAAAIYTEYGDASLAFGLSAVADQTIAGVIMKLGGTILLWTVITITWFRWVKEEQEWVALEESAQRTSPDDSDSVEAAEQLP